MSNQYNQNYPNNNDSGYRGRRFRDDDRTAYGAEIDNFDENARPAPYRPQTSVRDNYGYSQDDNFRPRQQVYRDDPRRYDSGRRQPADYDDSYDSYDGYDRRAGNRGYDNRAYDNRAYDNRGYDNRGYSNRGYDTRYDDRYDSRYDSRGRKPKKRTSPAIVVIRVIAVIMLLAGAGIVGYKLYDYYMDSKGHSELQALSQDFNALYARNNDFFGWLKIDDTVIDYPVMYTPYDPEKYLHTDFDGDYSESGELFIDADCDTNGYHYLIYGHHMFNGSMFGSLPKYADQDYFNEHRTLRFDTMSEMGEYEIFAVFYSQIYDEYDDVFKYYNCANLDDEGTYNYYVENVKAMSLYDTGITPVYGEKIVTLSTCNYHTEDGRFVVAARKK